MSKISKNENLLETARNLRKEMTRQERHLWYDFLRTYPVKIYKQRIIGNYVVDFYCAAAKLVIEIDGIQHLTEEAIAYDKQRTEYLNLLDLKVIRFQNIDVDRYFHTVCTEIDRSIQDRINGIVEVDVDF